MSSKMVVMAASLSHCRTLTSARVVAQPMDLIRWVRREGGFVHPSVKIANLNDTNLGLGLVASDDIPKGSKLITLPHHVPLRFQSKQGDSSLLINLAHQYIPEELWAMKLGLKLLQERAVEGSFWWPYISNLPETYNVPIFFPGEDIKYLQYAPLLHQVNKRCRFLLDFENLLRNELENVKLDSHPFRGQAVDASSLGWAMSAVSSRAFRLHCWRQQDGTHVKEPMLLPLIDMCNHSFTPNAEIVQEKEANDENFVNVVAGAHIKQNDPLELNYGCLNNDLFLLDYGFVIPSNPYDCIELKYDSALLDAASMAAGFSSPNFSSPSPWQQQILSQLNLNGENPDLKINPESVEALSYCRNSHGQLVLEEDVRIGGSELVEDRLLAALRVILSNDKEAVEKQDLSTLKSISSEAPLGISNEATALRSIVALCVIALSHFPTKIMEDESLLKQNVSSTTELAVRYRIQKKSVIIDAMRDLTNRVRLLSSKESVMAN